MSTTELNIIVRSFIPKDEPVLVKLGKKERMGTLSGFQTTLVAVTQNKIAGFCRIRTYEGHPYVNPIIVSQAFRHKGVGEKLMKCAQGKWGTLRFVARGYAVPFYQTIGCRPIGWNSIADEVIEDCRTCSMYSSCKPLPMVYESSK